MKRKLAAVLMLIIAVSVIAAPACYAEEFENYEAYDTKSFDVSVVIDESNTYKVTERITVDFKSDRHGIFRYIPYLSTMVRDMDGYTGFFPERASISHLKVDGYEYSTSTENGNMVITIGDEDKYVNGLQTYVITYKYRPHDDRIADYDEIYFNILPHNLPTPVESAEFMVTLPKSVEPEQVFFYSGERGEADADMIAYSVEDNVIKASLKEAVPRYNGVTLKVNLPGGYFASQRNDSLTITIIWAAIIIVPLLVLLLWFLFGRDRELVKPVAVMPPQGMTPADVGYIVDESVDHRDIMSLLFYWGEKGYIKIDEAKDSFLLTRLNPLPVDSNEYEHIVFDKLFRKGDMVDTSTLSGEFYDTMSTARAGVKSKFASRNSISLYTAKSKVCEGIATVFMIIPVILCAIASGIINMADPFSIIIGVVCSILLWVAGISFVNGIRRFNSKNRTERISNLLGSVIAVVLLSVLLCISAATILRVDDFKIVGKYYFDPLIAMTAAVIGFIISTAITSIMRRRTDAMNEMYGEVLGFKEFIEYAERDKLEELNGENPHYFYDILPYALVLGLADKWAKKFEDIDTPQPVWYGGMYNHPFNTYIFMRAITHNLNAAQTHLSVPPAPKEGSFNSGGFGGGFSGGGGGGGGMGSW